MRTRRCSKPSSNRPLASVRNRQWRLRDQGKTEEAAKLLEQNATELRTYLAKGGEALGGPAGA